jgi:hypothetical protein
VQPKGGEASFSSIQNGAVRLSQFLDEHGEPAEAKAVASLMKNAKNLSKHMNGDDDPAVDFDPKAEAKNLLDLGGANQYQLMEYYELEKTDLLIPFNNERGVEVRAD